MNCSMIWISWGLRRTRGKRRSGRGMRSSRLRLTGFGFPLLTIPKHPWLGIVGRRRMMRLTTRAWLRFTAKLF